LLQSPITVVAVGLSRSRPTRAGPPPWDQSRAECRAATAAGLLANPGEQPPRPTHVGNEKYLADFWIIAAFDLDVALKLATEGSKHCNRKVEVRPFL